MAGQSNVWDKETKITGKEREQELKKLLIGAMVLDIETSSGGSLNKLTLKLKNGKTAELEEESCASWEGSTDGWINVTVK
jgi:hypothetical protein